MSLNYKLYTLDNKFISESFSLPNNFTGIIEYSNGSKSWHLNSKWHRLDGPAIERSDGSKEWYINDEFITKKQHKLYVDLLKLKGLL